MRKFFLPKFWRTKEMISYALLPFSFIYRLVVWLRRFYWRCFPGFRFSVPIIVVGNITVGGAGKTPLVIFLAELLKSHGYTPGIVSRGYGRKSKGGTIIVTAKSKPEDVGDEALLISHRIKCPMLVDVDRVRAVRELVVNHDCNVVISDDGLQHYALARYLEIVVVDSEFKFGNKFCLPAGPLREPLSRLKEVDFIVKNFNSNAPSGFCRDNEDAMVLEPVVFRNVSDPSVTKDIVDFNGRVAHAVAGIGNPSKFFQTLRNLGLEIIEHPFPDHHLFSELDFSFTNKEEKEIVIMTEKDAVKCDKIAFKNFWYIEVRAKPSQEFADKFLKKIQYYSGC